MSAHGPMPKSAWTYPGLALLLFAVSTTMGIGFAPSAGGILFAVSAADGKTLETFRLDSPPVWDGMAAANDRLFLSLADGCVRCWGTR